MIKKMKILPIAIGACLLAGLCVVGGLYYFQRDTYVQTNGTSLSQGEYYLATMQYEEAVVSLQQAIAVEPKNAEAYMALSQTHAAMGDMDMAQQILEAGYEETNSTVITRMLEELEAQSQNTQMADEASGVLTVQYVTVAGVAYPQDTETLILRNCGLTTADLTDLAQLTNLKYLDISGNGLGDISPIAQLTTLEKFYAAHNEITDISALSQLNHLVYVGLRDNHIADADALFAMEGLRYLHLTDNAIESVPALGSQLALLYLEGNSISEVVSGTNLIYCDLMAEEVEMR